MRYPRLVALLIAAFGAVPPLPAAEPALGRLVAADTALVIELHDLPALQKNFADSSFGRAWADPDIARFFAPFSAQTQVAEMVEKVKAETGYTPAELLDFATGDVLVTVPVASIKLEDGSPDADVLFALEVGDNEAKLRELIEAQRKKQTDAATVDTTEDYNGVVLHLHSPAAPDASVTDPMDTPATSAKPGKSLVWALHQGRWFIASSRELVTSALDALAAGGLSTSLLSSPEYVKVIDRAGGRADTLLYFNWKAVYPAVVAAIEAGRDPNAKPNLFGIEPVNVMKALGLDAIEGFSVTSATVGDINRFDAAFTYSEARGIPALLAYRDGPVARPDWVPAAWFNVSSQNFSVPEAYAELERILDRVSPMVAGMAQGQIKTFEREVALDLKRDLIGNLGASFVSGYALPAGANADTPPAYDELDQFIGLSLADAAAFERAVEVIKAKYLAPGDASPLKKRDYLGRVIYSFESRIGGRDLSYAISDGWLLVGIGSSACIESVVQSMNAPDTAASFWQRKDVRDILAEVPAGAFSVQHTELAPLFASLAASLVKYQENETDENDRYVDPAATPTREQLARFFKASVSHGVRTPEGLFFHSEGPSR